MNDNKLDRLNKVAHEASKQCLRSISPIVTYCGTLAEALEKGKDNKNKLFACEFAKKSDINIKNISGDTSIVVGSEGGFSEKEFTLAKNMGYSGITLGKRILRAETAAIALTAVIMFAIGELE
jgi:16S rRNA (uracil1498-N3)-methyltransferase